jgi:hypothetical protein
MKTYVHLWSYFAEFFLDGKEKVVEKIKTSILCTITFLENRSAYEIMVKYMVEPDSSQKAIK